MTPQVVEELRRTLVSCLLLAQPDPVLAEIEAAFVAAVQPVLDGLFGFLARARSLEASVQVDTRHPGYVIFEGATPVFVPVHLVIDFPARDVRDEVTALGQHLRICTDSALCISGSTLFLGKLNEVSDLDCCEYVDRADDRIGEAFKSVLRRTKPSACLRLKVGLMGSRESAERTWTPDQTAVGDKMSRLIRIADGGKVDFVVRTSFAGVIDASTLVLRADASMAESGAALNSFAAQEAVLGRWVPRQLTNAKELGRYLAWLRAQLSEHRVHHPVKALKRALSLSRLLMLDQTANAVIALLNRSMAGAVAQRQAKETLAERLRLAPELIEYTQALDLELKHPRMIFDDRELRERTQELCDDRLRELSRLEDTTSLGR